MFGGFDPELLVVQRVARTIVEAHRQALEARPAVPESDAKEDRAGQPARMAGDRHQLSRFRAIIDLAHHRGVGRHQPRLLAVDGVKLMAQEGEISLHRRAPRSRQRLETTLRRPAPARRRVAAGDGITEVVPAVRDPARHRRHGLGADHLLLLRPDADLGGGDLGLQRFGVSLDDLARLLARKHVSTCDDQLGEEAAPPERPETEEHPRLAGVRRHLEDVGAELAIALALVRGFGDAAWNRRLQRPAIALSARRLEGRMAMGTH